jgi:hypothetical protein
MADRSGRVFWGRFDRGVFLGLRVASSARGVPRPDPQGEAAAARGAPSLPSSKPQGEAAAARGVPSHPLVPRLVYSRVLLKS